MRVLELCNIVDGFAMTDEEEVNCAHGARESNYMGGQVEPVCRRCPWEVRVGSDSRWETMKEHGW